MREIIARIVCGLTVAAVVVAALLFAAAHNLPVAAAAVVPAPAAPPAGKASPPPAAGGRGRAVYAAQNCATCHAIAGAGNPRYPLDGVGARWDAAELRGWITGSGMAADILPAAIAKRKQRYQAMSPEDLSALVDYLSTLKAPPKSSVK